MILYNELSDTELVLLLAEDDYEAFRILYSRYWKRMLVKAFTQLKSHVDAEEVVQDSFVNLWRRRKTVEIKHTFHTYIGAVVRYEVMAKIAGNKKNFVSIEDAKPVAIEDDSTQQWLAFSDLQEEIEAAIQSLPDKCRLVFRMSRNNGLTEKQISEELGVSKKTVEAHMSKALKNLRLKLDRNFIFIFYTFD